MLCLVYFILFYFTCFFIYFMYCTLFCFTSISFFFCRTTLLHIPTADGTQTFRFHKTSQSLYHRSECTTRTSHLFLSYQFFSLFLFSLFNPIVFQIIFNIMITVIITSSMSIMFLFYHQFLLINSVLNFMCTTFFSYFILYYTNLTSLHFYSIFQFLNTQYFLQYCCPFAKLRTTIFYLTRHILSFRYNSVCERIRYYILIQFICQLYFIKLKA